MRSHTPLKQHPEISSYTAASWLLGQLAGVTPSNEMTLIRPWPPPFLHTCLPLPESQLLSAVWPCLHVCVCVGRSVPSNHVTFQIPSTLHVSAQLSLSLEYSSVSHQLMQILPAFGEFLQLWLPPCSSDFLTFGDAILTLVP